MFSKERKKGKGFDVVSAINKITPENIEFHLLDEGDDGVIRKSSFTGPNTNLRKRLRGFDSENGSFSSIITPPINRLDEGALVHDLAYTKYKDLPHRHKHLSGRKRIVHPDQSW